MRCNIEQVDRVIRNDSSRQVVAYHRTSPRLDITLTFNEQSDVTFLYDESYLEDFHGAVFLDKYSNRYLNITLIGGSGSIVGTIMVSSICGTFTRFLFKTLMCITI